MLHDWERIRIGILGKLGQGKGESIGVPWISTSSDEKQKAQGRLRDGTRLGDRFGERKEIKNNKRRREKREKI